MTGFVVQGHIFKCFIHSYVMLNYNPMYKQIHKQPPQWGYNREMNLLAGAQEVFSAESVNERVRGC